MKKVSREGAANAWLAPVPRFALQVSAHRARARPVWRDPFALVTGLRADRPRCRPRSCYTARLWRMSLLRAFRRDDQPVYPRRLPGPQYLVESLPVPSRSGSPFHRCPATRLEPVLQSSLPHPETADAGKGNGAQDRGRHRPVRAAAESRVSQPCRPSPPIAGRPARCRRQRVPDLHVLVVPVQLDAGRSLRSEGRRQPGTRCRRRRTARSRTVPREGWRRESPLWRMSSTTRPRPTSEVTYSISAAT
jgi:hypothetical protein